MTAVDAVGLGVVVPAPAAQPAGSGSARFVGSERAFFGLLVRGAVLLLLTLGIYRFWLATDIRRFLWGHTEVAGEALEYTGTALELLVGFLMAMALLIPVYTLFFIAALDLGVLGSISGVLAFMLLALLGQFAVYRARRYRLTRTVYRGVRLHQTGSAWTYALLSLTWWGLTALTAGLAYPWQQARLERYKMRHTHYGNLDGRFVATGGALFVRGIWLWLIVVGPFLAGVVLAILHVDWLAIAAALAASGDTWKRIESASPDFAAAIVLAMVGIGWAVLAAALVYPLFRAIVLRWWLSGLRLGEVVAVSHLRTGQIYRVYLRFVGYALLFAILALVAAFAAGGLYALVVTTFEKSTVSEVVATLLFVGGYVVIALGYSTIYQATVTIRFWRLSFETTALAGLQALERVEARGTPSTAFGEGLADALDVGGL